MPALDRLAPRRRGRSSGRRAARRPGGPPGTWRSSPRAPRGSRRASVQRHLAPAPRRRRGSPRCRPRRPRSAAPRRSASSCRRRQRRSGPALSRVGSGATAGGVAAEPHPDPLGDQVDVGAVLDDDAHRLLEGLAVDVVGAQQQQRPRPVDRLGDRGRLLQVELADHAARPRPAAAPASRRSSGACRRTISISRSSVGVVEPEVEAAALQRLGQLARVVRGEHDDRHACVASITPSSGIEIWKSESTSSSIASNSWSVLSISSISSTTGSVGWRSPAAAGA